jgi:hypothetical protein
MTSSPTSTVLVVADGEAVFDPDGEFPERNIGREPESLVTSCSVHALAVVLLPNDIVIVVLVWIAPAD